MKWINYMFVFLGIILMCNCKSNQVKSDNDLPLDIVAKTYVEKTVNGTRLKEAKSDLKLYISVYTDSGYFRNSKYILQIYIWDKNLFGSTPNDSIFSYQGIDSYFGSTEYKYKKLFKKKFAYIAGKAPKNDYKSLSDAISQISVYFNQENEITYIDFANEMYYNLLRDKVKFSKVFMLDLKVDDD
ncbi:hypothetical protein IMCC3317_00360 [Kordia antarctica]|uniref:Uncharacterized protein n=1 Tax=Kordia antarctica TaxID=1218801 RepID=A0A7L4ZCN4_9FLAO|nr:hypothetical protein [Kordia antarctica]QHI34693.1 hypothetical protein IMCC3317_00360 [Kordia antarctica]